MGPTLFSAAGSLIPASARGSTQLFPVMGYVTFDMQRPDGVNTLSDLDARINRACLSRKWIISNDPMRVLRVGGPETHETPRAAMSLNRAVSFLSCSMRVEPERFCTKFYRRRLAYRLKDFLKLVVRRRRQFNRMMSDANNRKMAKMFKKVHESSGGKRTTGVTSGSGPIMPKKLVNAVSNLSHQGYLLPSDFASWGSKVPEPLRSHVIKTRGNPSCQ